MPTFTPDELKRLELRNIENMLIYYKPELRLIAEGASPNRLLGRKLIKRLLILKILEERSGFGSGRLVTLSNKGRQLIGLPGIESS